MLAECGLYLLILAWLCAMWQSFFGLYASHDKLLYLKLAGRCAYVQVVLVAASFAVLIALFLLTDLSVLNVVQNSHTQKPLIYKIAASWASHEGSMLLWCLMLAVFGTLVTISKDMDLDLKRQAIGVQGLLCVGFLAFLILSSSPFERVFVPLVDGQDLNPILQDPALAIHPPMLFLGYVGFSAQFALAVALLINGKSPDQGWVKIARRFTLIAWFALTAGLCLGSYWAYYELGWGGWWFWDPVENAALMPWLTGTALLHCLRVLEVRRALPKWTILLSIATFGLSVMGTFLVRSGLLTSVHSFAVDPERGLFILALAVIYIGGALLLYGIRTPKSANQGSFHILSRETALVLNNLILVTMVATVFIGTAYPIILPLLGGREISVGAPYFNTVLLPLAVPMLILMGVGLMAGWSKTTSAQKKKCMRDSLLPLLIAGIAGLATIMLFNNAPLSAGLWIALAIWLVGSVICHLWGKYKKLNDMPATHLAMAMAHIGVGVAIIGMVGSGLLVVEREAILQKGESIQVGGYVVTMQDVRPVIGPNYVASEAVFDVRETDDNDFVTELTAQRRTYPIAGSKTTETAIRTRFKDAIYIALGEADAIETSRYIVRVRIHPLIAFLWIGMGLVVLSSLAHIRFARIRTEQNLKEAIS